MDAYEVGRKRPSAAFLFSIAIYLAFRSYKRVSLVSLWEGMAGGPFVLEEG